MSIYCKKATALFMKFSLQQFNRLGCISVVNPNGQMFLRFYNKAQIKLHVAVLDTLELTLF